MGHTSFYYALLYCTVDAAFFFFNKSKVYGNPVLTKSISTIFSIASAHFMSGCRVLVILALFQTVSLLHILW